MARLSEDITFGYLDIWENHDENFFIGGILTVNNKGVPKEYFYSDKIKVSELQKLLYGESLKGYLITDIIANKIIDKLEKKPNVIFVKDDSLLNFREICDIPLLKIILENSGERLQYSYTSNKQNQSDVIFMRRMPEHSYHYNLVEPFQRLQESMSYQYE